MPPENKSGGVSPGPTKNNGNPSNQNKCDLENSVVPSKYLNELGFINYNHQGHPPWIEEILLPPEYIAITPILGIDCEMVGVGPLKESVLGRVSIVNQFGLCLYDTFVRPPEEVTEFRTQFSGIRPQDMEFAPPMALVLTKVEKIVQGRTLVGHSIHNDLKVLKMEDHQLIRDTAVYFKSEFQESHPPSLKSLTKMFLNLTIQDGEHSSIIDAQATLKIYLMHQDKWERSLIEKLESANILSKEAGISRIPIDHMHVQPRETDLKTDPKTVYIRKNRIVGSYEKSKEYVDIQFRLMLEDFLRPLRLSVKEVKKIRGHKNKNIITSKIGPLFHNVRVRCNGRAEVDVKGCKTIQIPIKGNKLENVDWEESKLFMTGSLVLLTNNNFRNVKFAEVILREESLENCSYIPVVVKFANEGPSWIVESLHESNSFLMMESTAFYAPYKFTLEYLQVIDLDKFPMKKYIVDVQTESITPAYLHKFSKTKLDFSALMKTTKENDTDSEDSENVNPFAAPLDLESWPPAEKLSLDPSQYEAFQKALTQELTIIQGPPGTGKTFIGIQIVKLLLTNLHMLTSPILIVSYTNHALDQVLEQVYDFVLKNICDGNEKEAIHKVLRAGCGSKSEIVKPLTIQNKKDKHFEFFKSQQRVNYYKEIINPVKDLDFEKLFLEQGILNFAKLPKKVSAVFNWSKNTKEIFSKWNEFQSNITKNPYTWFNIKKAASKKKTPTDPKITKMLAKAKSNKWFLLERNLEQTLSPMIPRIKELIESGDLHTLKLEKFEKSTPTEEQYLTRWAYYLFLVKQLAFTLKDIQRLYKDAQMGCKELNHFIDIKKSIKQALVMGMTTTGAVKHKHIILGRKVQIMIVEEAAHVLEAHVVASLTEYCEQMIMIGDHKQLRPLTADNNLAVEYNLDVSLMERLVKNGEKQGKKNWIQLKVQHRMRPEIARMVCPVIYEELYNHPDVMKYPHVRGCAKNIFFVHHEQTDDIERGSLSPYNEYEVRFTVGLVEYFLNEKYYKGKQITVIAAYATQTLLISNELKKKNLTAEVRVSTIDGYQGEENDIIVLSLVRSNPKNHVGFLKTDNRVCVALSRARHGLFIVGNMTALQASSETWNYINGVLVEMGCIGSETDFPKTGPGFCIPSKINLSFTLPNGKSSSADSKLSFRQAIEALTASSNAPSELIKSALRELGVENSNVNGNSRTRRNSKSIPYKNSSPSICKIKDNENKSAQIPRTTAKTNTSSRLKPKKNQNVTTKSPIKNNSPPPISSKAEFKSEKDQSTSKILENPTANAKTNAAIKNNAPTPSSTSNKNQSQSQVTPNLTDNLNLRLLPTCGHLQKLTPRQLTQNRDEIKCIFMIEKELPCKHQTKIHCHIDVNNFKCQKDATIKLKCGHSLTGQCHEINDQNYVCKDEKKQQLACGHLEFAKCHMEFTGICKEKQELHCGHEVDFLCGQELPIGSKCSKLVEFKLEGCEHKQRIPCWQNEKVKIKKCGFMVWRTMKCGHQHQIACHIPLEEIVCTVKELSNCIHKTMTECGQSCKKCKGASQDLTTLIKKMTLNPASSAIAHNFSKVNDTSESKIGCQKIFKCGHRCRFFCKKNETRRHLQYKCLEPCQRVCPEKGHSCSGDHDCFKHCHVYMGNGCRVPVPLKCACGAEILNIECSAAINANVGLIKSSCEACGAKFKKYS